MESNGKKKRAVPLIAGVMFLAIVILGVSFFCHDKFKRVESGSDYAFDGWIYGREDQKKANAALIQAGLDAFSWESGKILVPKGLKKEYQLALTNAGAYPKAPSNSRGEALRQMNPFESDAKSKMRELDANALQLELTIEQLRGVEYATVGVNSRREQAGLSFKNVVTASIGVAYADGYALDSNAVFAITAAAKRQLGIDKDENVAILDLKEGTSYIGSENNLGADSVDVALQTERERVERYWREKYLNAFADVKNIRITVNAELVPIAAENLKSQESRENKIVHRSGDNHRRNDSRIVQTSSEEPRAHCSAALNSSGFATLGSPNRSKMEKSRALRPQTLEEASRVDAVPVKSLESWKEQADLRLVELDSHMKRSDYAAGYKIPVDDPKKCDSPKIRQTAAMELVGGAEPAFAKFQLRSISFHFGVPRSYIWKAARQAVTLNYAKETFAGDDQEKEKFFLSIQDQLLEETREHAVSVFRPTAEKLGWSEEVIEHSFWFDVYSDPECFDKENVKMLDAETHSSVNFGSADDGVKNNLENKGSEGSEGAWEPVTETFGEDELPNGGKSILASPSGKIAEKYESEEMEIVEQDTRSVTEPLAVVSQLDFKRYLTSEFWMRRVVVVNAIYVFATLIVLVAFLKFLRKKAIPAKKTTTIDAKRKFVEVQETPTTLHSPRTMNNNVSYSSELDDEIDRDLDRDLQEIALSKTREMNAEHEEERPEDEFSIRQKQVLDLISRYPERAAASLQGWVKDSNF